MVAEFAIVIESYDANTSQESCCIVEFPVDSIVGLVVDLSIMYSSDTYKWTSVLLELV